MWSHLYDILSKVRLYYRDEEKISGCQSLERGGGCDYKGLAQGTVYCDGFVVCPDCDGSWLWGLDESMLMNQ